MLELGKRQRLSIVKKVDFGVYLAEHMPAKGESEKDMEMVLLPVKQVPEEFDVGDSLEVFLYKDSKDRLIATVNEPLITLGKIARLQVVQVSGIGAFLNWGLEKDLLLPFKEQTRKVKEGEEILVALYIDKSSRLCATMNVYPYLDTDSPYGKDDRVEGTVYEISREFGAFVAVDNRYSGLIPKKELYGEIHIGERIRGRVTEVKEDGKLNLSIREKAYLQIGTDAEKVMEAIERCGGALPFNDKASPEVIRTEMQMSKNEFKRAVGHLLKAGKITITEKAILKNKN